MRSEKAARQQRAQRSRYVNALASARCFMILGFHENVLPAVNETCFGMRRTDGDQLVAETTQA